MAPFGGYHWESWAGWSLAWRIPPTESGLEIWWADFNGRRILWRGSAPFAIVPYHIDPCGVDPKPPNYTFKDGFDPQCDGASFLPLQHGAPNKWNHWGAFSAAQDTDAVVVKKEAADDFHPARMS